MSSNILSKTDAQNEAIEKFQADLLSQSQVLEVIKAAVEAISGSSSQEVEVLQEVSKRLAILKELAPGVAALVELLSKSTSTTKSLAAASGFSLQDELDNSEEIDLDTSETIQEDDGSTEKDTKAQEAREGYDYRGATDKLQKQRNSLALYNGALL